MRTLIGTAVFLICSQSPAFTGQTVENFATKGNRDWSATTAVWNVFFNRVQPPLTVCTSAVSPCAANTEDFDVDIGDGSDGPFDLTTYSNFGSVSGTTITIDTNKHPVFNFTSFNLPAGWTLQGTGTNMLWLKVQGTFNISGSITCSGGDGQPVTSNITTPAAGGVGVCGGANGGAGGFSGANGQNGQDGGNPNNTHGSGGVNSATVAFPNGGGGGGSFGGATATTAGTGGTAGGAGGTTTNDAYMTNLGTTGFGPGGGSGGGGGGAYLFSNALTSRGGGGGAGGGIIRIAVGGDFNQTSTGQILANGGNGGDGNAALGGGAGGGGGGGTIIIHGGGNFTDNGIIHALSLNGGAAGNGNPQGAGGVGANGRNWLTQLGSFSGAGSEQPPFQGAGNLGDVHYKTASSYVAQSTGYDSLNTSPTYSTFSFVSSLPGTSTATLLVGGSNDNFVTDDTGFVAPTNSAALAGKRYFRFKVQFQLVPGGAATVPATISSVSANYTGRQQTNFQMTQVCGTFGGPGEFFFDFLACLLIGLLTTGRLRKGIRFRQSKSFPAL